MLLTLKSNHYYQYFYSIKVHVCVKVHVVSTVYPSNSITCAILLFIIIIIQDGRSVLHFAACNRSHPEVAELQVTKYSIDVNKQDKVQRG